MIVHCIGMFKRNMNSTFLVKQVNYLSKAKKRKQNGNRVMKVFEANRNNNIPIAIEMELGAKTMVEPMEISTEVQSLGQENVMGQAPIVDSSVPGIPLLSGVGSLGSELISAKPVRAVRTYPNLIYWHVHLVFIVPCNIDAAPNSDDVLKMSLHGSTCHFKPGFTTVPPIVPVLNNISVEERCIGVTLQQVSEETNLYALIQSILDNKEV